MNPYDLSIYDPTAPITPGRVGPYVKSLSVVDGKLTATMSNSEVPVVLGKYKGPSGLEVTDVEVTEDKRIKVIYSDSSTHLSPVLTSDMNLAAAFSGTGLFVSVDELGYKSTDVASNGMYYLIPKYSFMNEVQTAGECITVDGVRVYAPPRENDFPVPAVLARLPQGDNNLYIYPSGTPVANRKVDFEFPIPTTLDGLILANNRYDFATRQFKVSTSLDGVTWVDILTGTMAHSVVPETYTLNEGVKFKYLRFWSVSITGDGGIGRIDLLTKSNAAVKPKVLDSAYLLPSSPEFNPGASFNNYTLKNGIKLTSLGNYNADYHCYWVLRRVYNPGATYVMSGVNSWIQFEFPTPTMITGLIAGNGRADYRTKQFKIDTSMDGVSWTTVATSTLPNTGRSQYTPIATNPVCKYVRFTALSGWYENNVGLHRLDLLTGKPGTALVHRPIVFDPVYFGITEKPDSLRISRTAAPSPAIPVIGGVLAYSDYCRLEWVIPSNDLVLPGYGANNAVVIPMGSLVVNNANATYKPPVLTIPRGRWKVLVSLVVAGVTNGFLILQDSVTKAELARGYAFGSNTSTQTDEHTLSVEFDISCTKPNTSLVLKLMSAAAGRLPSAGKIAGIVQLWKADNDVSSPVVIIPGDIAPPAMLANRGEMQHIDGLTSGSNGKEFFDNTTSGATLNSAGHFVTVVIKSPSKLWRRSFNGAATSIGQLSIRRLDDNLDLTRLSVPIAESQPDGTWSQFTSTLEPGTYRFGYLSRARTDSQWFAELDKDYVELVDAIPTPLTANSGGSVTVSASSEYADGKYPPWKAFQKAYTNSEFDQWLSSAIGVTDAQPAWLMVEFPTPTIIRAYQIWNGAGPHATKGSLQGSSDGIEWTTLHEFDLPTSPSNYSWLELYVISKPSAFTKYRYHITRNSSASHVGVGEMVLYKPKE
jgi:hypothetical protein